MFKSILKKSNWILIPMILMTSTCTSAAGPFTDVKVGDKHYVAISYLKELGIINGYEDGTFRDEQNVTRAEAVKMLMLASKAVTEEDILNTDTSSSPFTDTSVNDWYNPYIKYAKDNNIVQGFNDGSFHPNDTVILVSALKIYLESYDNLIYPLEFRNHWLDVDENEWYAKYLRYADARDMIETYPSNKIYPNQEINRGDLAGLIYRHQIHAKGQYEFGKATFYGSAVQGHYTASGEIFDLNKLTAAHKSLPFGSIVEVTNMANGESVQVRITDRGPYGPGRVIDLTTEAFSRIAWIGTGVIHVQVKTISIPE